MNFDKMINGRGTDSFDKGSTNLNCDNDQNIRQAPANNNDDPIFAFSSLPYFVTPISRPEAAKRTYKKRPANKLAVQLQTQLSNLIGSHSSSPLDEAATHHVPSVQRIIVLSKNHVSDEWNRQKQIDGFDSDELFLRSLLFPKMKEENFKEDTVLEVAPGTEVKIPCIDLLEKTSGNLFDLQMAPIDRTKLSRIQFTEDECNAFAGELPNVEIADFKIDRLSPIKNCSDYIVEELEEMDRDRDTGMANNFAEGKCIVENAETPLDNKAEDLPYMSYNDYEPLEEKCSIEKFDLDVDQDSKCQKLSLKCEVKLTRCDWAEPVTLVGGCVLSCHNYCIPINVKEAKRVFKKTSKLKKCSILKGIGSNQGTFLVVPVKESSKFIKTEKRQVKTKKIKIKKEKIKKERVKMEKKKRIRNRKRKKVEEILDVNCDKALCRVPLTVKIHDGVCTICKRKVGVWRMHIHYSREHKGELPFVCPNCKLQCTHYSRFYDHCYGRRPQPPCSLCGLKFSGWKAKMKHMRTTHPDLKKKIVEVLHNGMCSICKQTFAVTSLHNHFLTEHPDTDKRPFECPTCDYDFRRYDRYRDHVKKHPSNLTCDYCKDSFPRRCELMKHRLDAHSISFRLTYEDDNQPKFKTSSTGRYSSSRFHDGVCNVCGEQFSMFKLEHHYKLEHPQSTRKAFECQNCDKSFNKYCSLTLHTNNNHDLFGRKSRRDPALLEASSKQDEFGPIQSKQGGKPTWTMPRCLSNYSKTSRFHNGVCNVCNIKLSCQQLERHHKQEHRLSGRKAFECTKCDKAFTSYTQFAAHALYHTNAFRCNVCEKYFINKISLKEHTIANHTNQTFPCQMCQKVFESTLRLNFHIKHRHESASFICDLCGVVSKNSIEFKRHQYADHTGKFQCDVCGKKLRSSGNLKNHRMVFHENRQRPKNVVCELCGDKFYFPKDLRKHIAKCH